MSQLDNDIFLFLINTRPVSAGDSRCKRGVISIVSAGWLDGWRSERATVKLGLYFLRPLADADFHAERRRCTAAASVFQRKLRRA